MIDEETGYILLNRFSRTTADEIEAALQKLESQGMKNLMLDLRHNAGGYLEQAVDILDKFIERKKDIHPSHITILKPKC